MREEPRMDANKREYRSEPNEAADTIVGHFSVSYKNLIQDLVFHSRLFASIRGLNESFRLR